MLFVYLFVLVVRGVLGEGFLISLRSNDYFFVIPTVCRWRGFEGTDLATLAHLEHPTVCHGHPVQILLLTSSLKQAWTR